MSENTMSNTKKDRKTILLILGAAVGIFLLIFGSIGAKKESKAVEEKNMGVLSDPSPEVYAEEVERQVIEICSRVKGAGTVNAVVTLKGGYRAVYATDSQSTTSGYKNSTVLIGSGSSEEALFVCYENPEISGIGIVCSGAEDPAVRQNIISLVSAAFNIGTNKIYVASG